MKTVRGFFKKGDMILALVLVTLCAAAVLLRGLPDGELLADIYVGGELYTQINLSIVGEEYSIALDGVEIEVENGGIRFAKADCPDGTCVRHGLLSHGGEVMACVPNKTVISLHDSGGGKKPHALTY